MRPFFYFSIFIVFMSCGKDKIVQLPEINYSKISEIQDVSAAYLFYDESLPDSVELNRKNLISTTNWLVNVDKRLTLEQVIPKIIFLQDKKRNAELHKNENAKNYFTCNDINIKNLGFMEFTDVFYHFEDSDSFFNKKENKRKVEQYISLKFKSKDSVLLEFFTNGCSLIHTSNQLELSKHIESNLINKGRVFMVLEFSNKLLFQDYITYKSLLSQIDLKNVTIANDEFIFN